MNPAPDKRSVLWHLTGGMALIIAVAGGCLLSGVATAIAAEVGIREQNIEVIAVGNLFVGFTVALIAALRDLTGLARGGGPSLPTRWLAGSTLALFVVGPIWRLFVVHVQEPISGSDAVRTSFDEVLYVLVLTSLLPLILGVPLVLSRLRKQEARSSYGHPQHALPPP